MNVVLVGTALMLVANMQLIRITSYGIDDCFYGQRHASSWHGETPDDAPEVVDDAYYGAASNDFPFGTVLRVTRIAECNGDPTIHATVRVKIVDRLAGDITGYVDLWPAPAKVLDVIKDGCFLGTIEKE
jgi:uncharacterized protein (DUF111 family)